MDYKEILKNIVNIINTTENSDIGFANICNYIGENCPEFKESEDELTWLTKYIEEEAYYLSIDIRDNEDRIKLKSLQRSLAWLEKQKEPKDKGEISDGYHTFNELYEYRKLYNAAFFNLLPKEWVHKSKKHHDGEECFGGGWFIVMANLPTGQISNHYELKDWDLFQIPEKDVADEWDGHTPQDAADRLNRYLLEKQGERQGKSALEAWKDMRLEVYQQASGNRHEPNYSDDTTKMFSLNDIDEIIEKISEQNTANKVEPKFHPGDWITHNTANFVFKIINVCSNGYEVVNRENYKKTISFDNEYKYHLWTINDAKDGDVLWHSDTASNGIFIFKEIRNDGKVLCYCDYDSEDGFCIGEYHTCCWAHDKYIQPATKEQRELLFKKTGEAGYKWYVERKRLKKVNYKK